MATETDLAVQAGQALTQLALYYAGAPIAVIAWAVALGGSIGGLIGIKTERKRNKKSQINNDSSIEDYSSQEGE